MINTFEGQLALSFNIEKQFDEQQVPVCGPSPAPRSATIRHSPSLAAAPSHPLLPRGLTIISTGAQSGDHGFYWHLGPSLLLQCVRARCCCALCSELCSASAKVRHLSAGNALATEPKQQTKAFLRAVYSQNQSANRQSGRGGVMNVSED